MDHDAACLTELVTERLANSLQGNASQDTSDRERTDTLRVIWFRMARNLCREVGRDNDRGRTSLDQTHQKFRGQLKHLRRVVSSSAQTASSLVPGRSDAVRCG